MKFKFERFKLKLLDIKKSRDWNWITIGITELELSLHIEYIDRICTVTFTRYQVRSESDGQTVPSTHYSDPYEKDISVIRSIIWPYQCIIWIFNLDPIHKLTCYIIAKCMTPRDDNKIIMWPTHDRSSSICQSLVYWPRSSKLDSSCLKFIYSIKNPHFNDYW